VSHQATDERDTDVELAADWFAKRRSGQLTLQELREMEVWLTSDPAHHEAFRSVTRAWSVVESVASDPQILALREAAVGRLSLRRVLRVAGSMVVIGGAIGVALYATGIMEWWKDWVSPVSNQQFQTAVGQTVTVTLADGSTATLDSDTTMVVHETWRRRDIALKHGQAFFHVAKDTNRPFTVAAFNTSVTATGTAFDVRVYPDRLTVLLTEGKLDVEYRGSESMPSEQTDMVAGWQLNVRSDGARALVPVSPESQIQALDWQTGKLAFVGQPLSAVAAELNRYTQKKIVVAADLAALQIDGVFRTGDIDGFVKLLVRSRLARVLDDTDAAITLTAAKYFRSKTRTQVHDL